jgi:parvulin-like peptidyl-prolyl isomerase
MNQFPSVKRLPWISVMFLGVLLCVETATGTCASREKLPITQGKEIVARVNGEPITLNEFNQELASLKDGPTQGKEISREERTALLRRLIDAKLVVQEARKTGLLELPEIKKMVDVFSRVALREQLMVRIVKNVKLNKEEAEKLYKEGTKEWKVSSVMFEKEDDAIKMADELKAGKTFGELSQQFIAAGTAKGGENQAYLKVKDINPLIVEAVSKMPPGSASPVIPIKTGFAIVKLEDVRYPENPEEIERAKWEVLKNKREQALKDYRDTLIKKYVKVDKKTLDSIDYESRETDFQQFLRDKRALAEIKGEKPVTVGELSQNLRQQLFHGVDRAIESKRLNAKKVSVLDDMLYRRVFRKEALRLGLHKSETYVYKVKEYEDSVIFGTFVQKAVVPDVKMKEEELKAYYLEHIGEYTMPEMIRIDSMVFSKRADAEGAIEKLRKGTDFQWLLANSDGQVDKNSKGLLQFPGMLLTVGDLPEGLQKAVSASKPGDLRLYASPEGYFYVLAVRQTVPSKPRPYEEAREEIAKKVFDDKLKKAMEEWTERLRTASDVKVYLKD